ncbi:MAG TPA: signal peptidase II [Opitutaceae bacterium]|nr:signal peptidase II [Opitutaceae bacterium]
MNNASSIPPEKPVAPPAGGFAAPPLALDHASRWQRLLAYRLLLVLALVVYALDQLTKYWIAARLPYPTFAESDGAIRVIRNFFYLTHVGNTGAAWSLFTGRSVLLGSLAALTLVAIFLWRHTLGLRARMPQICFGLLCGGIAGNLTDRLARGHVVDFIDLHFGSYVYPTFNIADSGICVGVLLYLWFSLRNSSP